MQKNKKNVVSKLIFLSLITTSIVVVISLSKFQSTITSANSAKVALYAIDAYSEANTVEDLMIDCAGTENLKPTASCSYVVTNKYEGKIAEVSVKYAMKVVFEQELPVGVTIAVSDENGREGVVTQTGSTYVFENEEWIFTPGTEQQNILTLTFNGENIAGATSSMISNVQVSVMAEQIN